jgi:hypothetical protein
MNAIRFLRRGAPLDRISKLENDVTADSGNKAQRATGCCVLWRYSVRASATTIPE